MDDGEEVDVRGFIPINIFGMVDLATCCTYLKIEVHYSIHKVFPK
jgi:hypothetical protein